MIRAVIFDIDDTLIDFMGVKRLACDKAVDAMIDAGLTGPKGKVLKELWALYDKHGWEDQRVFQKLLRKIEGEVDYRKLAYAIIAYRKARVGFVSTYPGTKDTLIQLKNMGSKLGIITDAPKLQAWLRLAQMRIDDFFDVIIISGRNHKGTGKPFLRALKRLEVAPYEMLHVGDRPERDVDGAQKVGVKACFAKYGRPDLSAPHADYTAKNIRDIVKIVEKENKNP
jgi:putative hydrolase of the HAD superfamily